jgi:hypothetical protein
MSTRPKERCFFLLETEKWHYMEMKHIINIYQIAQHGDKGPGIYITST